MALKIIPMRLIEVPGYWPFYITRVGDWIYMMDSRNGRLMLKLHSPLPSASKVTLPEAQ